jgi:cysteine synthase A
MATPRAKFNVFNGLGNRGARLRVVGGDLSNKVDGRTAPLPGPSHFLTPLLKLDFGFGLNALAKFEGLTPAKSHKDRWAGEIVKAMVATGRIGQEPATLVVPSSGRTAAAIALATEGLPVSVVVFTDVLSPSALRSELDAHPHVRTVVVNEPDATGSHLRARMRLVTAFLAQNPRAILIDQYGDPRIPLAYQDTLLPEILAQTGGEISAVFMPVGTGGLLRGFDLDKARNARRWLLIPVDAAGSAIFRKPNRGARRRFSGYGNAGPTTFINECSFVEPAIFVPDDAVVRASRWLDANVGIRVGASGAATVAAFMHAAFTDHPALKRAGIPLLILPDDGGAYADTLYDDEWVRSNGMGYAVH